MTFNYYLKDNSTQSQIRLVVRHRGDTYSYYTGLRIDSKSWNPNSKKAKTGIHHPEGKETNKVLDAILARAQKLWREYLTKAIDKDGKPTFAEFVAFLKDELDSLLMKTETSNRLHNMFNFIEHYIHEQETRKEKKPATLKRYKVTFDHLKRFFNYYPRRATWYSMDIQFSKAYCQARFNEDVSINTVWKELSVIKHWLNTAHELGYNPYLSHRAPGWMPKSFEPRNIYLSFAEVQQLYELQDLPDYLQRTVDEFTCAVFSGVRYSDFEKIFDSSRIQTDPDGFKYFIVDQRKTSYRCNIPVHPVVEEILKKYGGRMNVKSNQKMNQFLHEVCQRVAWGKEKVFLDHSRGGKVQSIIMEKWQAVTTHTARRSFATNMYLAGVPKYTIMQVTGHKKTTSFDRYIQVTQLEHAKIVGMNPAYKLAFEKTA